MVRQTENFSGGPMLNKTMLTYVNADAGPITESAAATWMQTAGAEVAFGNTGWVSGDPKSTMTRDNTNNSFDLPAGKWLFDVSLPVTNSAASAAEIELAVTNETDGGTQTLYAQSEATLPVSVAGTTSRTINFKLLVHLTEQTSGLQVRVANTQATGNGTIAIGAGGTILIQKIANKYDS